MISIQNMKKKPEMNKNSSPKLKIDTHEKTILEISNLVHEKVIHIQKIIQNTIISVNNHKKNDVFSNSDVIICINSLVELYEKSKTVLTQIIEFENPAKFSSTGESSFAQQKSILDEMNLIIDNLQSIIDKISIIISGFGTKYMEDLFFISFGSEFLERPIENEIVREKYQLILKQLQNLMMRLMPDQFCNIYVLIARKP